jgi:hypothetical protein
MRVSLEPGDPALIETFTGHIEKDYGRGRLLNYEVATKMIATRIWSACRRVDAFDDLAVVRFYRWTRSDELPPDMVALADDPAVPHWMMLTGSCGMIYDWTRRYQSGKHRLIKPGADLLAALPQAAFTQLGIETGAPIPAGFDGQIWSEGDSCRIYISPVVEHPLLPDHESFLYLCGVKGVIGFGARFPGGSGYVLLAYPRLPVSKESAAVFCGLEPFVTQFLTPYNQRPVLWSKLL